MGRYRLLLVDDHLLFRQGLRRLIEDIADLEVIGEAGDGLELLSLLKSFVPDMIILDISMPNLRGIEAISRVKTKCPGVKVLILSMHREYLHQALAAGADGYLLKEDTERVLLTTIEKIRQGKTFISPRLAEEVAAVTASPSEPLSLREREVLKLIAEGKSNKEIGDLLFISVRTVESHRAAIIGKLKIKSTADLVKYAIQKGYV
jgi:DNA-binding NarL/FixJ family response regulator